MANKALVRMILPIIIEVIAVALMFSALNFFLMRTSFPNSSISAWFLVDGILCLILSGIYFIGYREGNFVNPFNSVRSFGFPDAFRSYPKFALVMLIAGIIMLLTSFLTT